MAGELTPKFDPEALQRILQRAAELQARERDVSGSLTGDEVLSLGREVGIPDQYLRQAMLEVSRAHPMPEQDGWIDQMMGVAAVETDRIVKGDARDLEQQLVHYMENEEVFATVRQVEGHLRWEPRSGWHAMVRRATGSKQFLLQKAEWVSATVIQLEPGLCQVVLRGDIRLLRRGYIGGAAAMLSVGAAATLVLAGLQAFWAVMIMPIPVAAAASFGVAKSYKPIVDRLQLGLECALDALEKNATRQLPPRRTSLLDTVMHEVGSIVTPGGTRRGPSRPG